MGSIRYRTEVFSGLEYRNALDVMVYETFELGNSDILEYLFNGILKKHHCKTRWQKLINSILDQEEIWEIEKEEQYLFFADVLEAIKEVTKKDIEYVLWLADISTVKDFYGGEDENIDSYYVSDIILSDLGYDGTLYGYEQIPVRISEKELLQYQCA